MKGFLIGLAAVVVIVVLALVSVYNGIISTHEIVKAKWAQVESQLQRRSDLIPTLVNTVKGYMAHEKQIFEDITNARSAWAKAGNVDDKIKAAGETDSALARLLMVVENYPNLKADNTFLKLMDELAGTENRLAVERMRYNEAVKEYNLKVRTFPGNIIANKFGYKVTSEYFKADEIAKAAPEVNFN